MWGRAYWGPGQRSPARWPPLAHPCPKIYLIQKIISTVYAKAVQKPFMLLLLQLYQEIGKAKLRTINKMALT